MEQTLEALGGIILKAIPTVVILLFLHFYLKAMLFRPLQKVLKQRDELTAGARKAAEASLAAAERKAQEYEGKLNEARAELYRQHEETRKQWLQDQATQTAEARARMEATVKEARARIAAESEASRQTLRETSESLADQIATRILTRTAGEAA
jgi:F-type H+-transporting ATPase subunit b